MLIPMLPPQNLPMIPNLLDIRNFVNEHETILIGLSTYATGLYILHKIENVRISQGKSTLFSNRNSFSDQEKKQSWITPVFMTRPIPTLEDLKNKPQYLGTCAMVSQYVTIEEIKFIPCIQEYSEDWSNFYNTDIYIYKKKIM